MLFNSFCHLEKINLKNEKSLWQQGFLNWKDVINIDINKSIEQDFYLLQQGIRDSIDNFEMKNVDFFFEKFPRGQQWRMIKEFYDEIGYLDIETTGLSVSDTITVVSLFYRQKLYIFIQGKNLYRAYDILKLPKILITFNGNRFDIPFLERFFSKKFYHWKIDLYYLYKQLGFGGGLKKCEKAVGIDRGKLSYVNGEMAVKLWNEYKTNHNVKALKTLLSYNISDTVNLDKMSKIGYNMMLERHNYCFKKIQISDVDYKLPFTPSFDLIKILKHS
jgi:uncharacterized protein